VTPTGQYPIGVVNRWTLAALCFALAGAVLVFRLNEWLMVRGER